MTRISSRHQREIAQPDRAERDGSATGEVDGVGCDVLMASPLQSDAGIDHGVEDVDQQVHHHDHGAAHHHDALHHREVAEA